MPPRADLPLLGDVPPQLVRVLVVDLVDLLLAEVTAALADRAAAPGRLRPGCRSRSRFSPPRGGIRRECRRPASGRSPRCRGRSCGDELALAALAAALTAAAEELDAVGDDLDRPGAWCRPALPTRASRACRRRRRGGPFGEVLRAALALVAPDGDVEVVRLVAPVALGVLLARVDGDAAACRPRCRSGCVAAPGSWSGCPRARRD
jgi:hypothetical protein